MLHNATPEEIVEKISSRLEKKFDSLKRELKNQEVTDDLLTPKETCALLKIDPSTLWLWVKKGKIKKYAVGRRKYYKRSEILDNLILCYELSYIFYRGLTYIKQFLKILLLKI